MIYLDTFEAVARHFYELGCRRTAEKYDEIEYNKQRAEEHLATSGKTISVKPSDEVTINGHKVAYDKDKDAITMEEIPNDLEEAAEEWAKENYGINYMDFGFTQDAAFRAMYHFRAGAKWQKQHDAELIEIAYNDGITIGMTKQKEQMMKDYPKWRRIKAGERLPCPAYVWTIVYDNYPDCFEGRLMPNIQGVKVGRDTWYLPVDVIHNLPKED